MFRLLPLLTVLMLVLGLGQGVFSEGVTVTHLTYQHHQESFHEYIQQKAAQFEKLHSDIKVNIITGVHDKYNTMAIGGIAPDVLDLPDFAHLGAVGMLIDVRPLMERDGITSLLRPETVAVAASSKGQIYTVPWYLAVSPMYFNRDLYAKAGLQNPLEQGENWTWDALLVDAKKLTADVDGDGIPEAFGVDRPWGYWQRAVSQAGGAFYEFDDATMQPTKSLWNTPEVLRGVEYVREFYVNRVTPHLFPGVDQTKYYFWTGRTAIDVTDTMGIVGVYLLQADFDWEFSLQPKGPAGPISDSGVGGMHISTSTKNLEAVWEWVKFLAFDKDNMEEFTFLTGLIPAITAAQGSYPASIGILDKNYAAVFEQTLYRSPHRSYAVPQDLNPWFVNMNPVWEGSTPAAVHLQSIHGQKSAYIEALQQEK